MRKILYMSFVILISTTISSCSLFEDDKIALLKLEVEGNQLLLINDSSFDVSYHLTDEDFTATLSYSFSWENAAVINPKSTVTIGFDDIFGGSSETNRLYLISRPIMDDAPVRLTLEEGFFQN